MRISTFARLNLLLLATALLIPHHANGSSTDATLYTSSLVGFGNRSIAFSLRGGIGNIDDIAASFLDADGDKLVDGFTLDTLQQGVIQGSQTHSFAGTESAGITFLAFPVVTSNGFSLTAASFIPGLPAAAMPLTEQGSVVVTRSNGSPLLSIPLMIDPELLSDTLFENGFE